MKRLLILCALLCGCAAQEPTLIPVPVPTTSPPVTERPRWPIADLKGTENYGEIIKAYGASLKAERGYSATLEIIINGYRGDATVPDP